MHEFWYDEETSSHLFLLFWFISLNFINQKIYNLFNFVVTELRFHLFYNDLLWSAMRMHLHTLSISTLVGVWLYFHQYPCFCSNVPHRSLVHSAQIQIEWHNNYSVILFVFVSSRPRTSLNMQGKKWRGKYKIWNTHCVQIIRSFILQIHPGFPNETILRRLHSSLWIKPALATIDGHQTSRHSRSSTDNAVVTGSLTKCCEWTCCRRRLRRPSATSSYDLWVQHRHLLWTPTMSLIHWWIISLMLCSISCNQIDILSSC